MATMTADPPAIPGQDAASIDELRGALHEALQQRGVLPRVARRAEPDSERRRAS